MHGSSATAGGLRLLTFALFHSAWSAAPTLSHEPDQEACWMRRHSGGTAPPPTAAGTGAGGLPRVCSTASLALLRGFADAPGPVHCGVPDAGIGAGGPPSSERGCSSHSSCGGDGGGGGGAAVPMLCADRIDISSAAIATPCIQFIRPVAAAAPTHSV